LDINLLGAISLTKAVLPRMLKRKQGQIVAVSSMVGKYGKKVRADYSTVKSTFSEVICFLHVLIDITRIIYQKAVF
jgi:short-subunit dehydrogenase